MEHTGDWGVTHHEFLNLAVYGCDQVAAHTDRFITEEKAPSEPRLQEIQCRL
jgi:hypothetical protein